MKKYTLILITVLATVVTQVKCQQQSYGSSSKSSSSTSSSGDNKKLSFSAGANLALPLGDFGSESSIGFGGFIEANKLVSDQIIGFANLGFTTFSAKESGGGSTSLISVLAGAKYHLEKIDVGAGIGYGSISASGGGGSVGGLMFAPVITYNLNKIAISASYNTISVSGGSSSFLNFGIGYKF